MAQADYIISNQTFPNTRADINSTLQAIATTNSGTSAPTTQYAGQFWIDTTSSTWTLYIHDGSDDIQFATIDTSANTVNFIDSELGDNSVTTSKIADANVTSAKLSYPLTTFSSTGIDDNATSTAITIDSSNNVGIGITSTDGITNSKRLQIHDSSTNWTQLILSNATSGSAQGNGFNLNFNGTDAIVNNRENGSVSFRTNDTERMRIDSFGDVHVGCTSHQASASSGTGGSTLGSIKVSADTDVCHYFNRIGSDGTLAEFRKDGTAVGSIGTRVSRLYIGSGDTFITLSGDLDTVYPANSDGSGRDNAMDIGTSSGRFKDLYLGGGLYVGGTGTANKLDDYEEGLHTVTMTDTGGGATITMNTSFDQLSYTKIGRLVYITGVLLPSSVTGTFSGTTRITLPFTASSLTDQAGKTFMTIATYSVDWTAGTSPYLSIGEGSNTGDIGVSQDNSSGGQGRVNSSSQVYISGSYITDA